MTSDMQPSEEPLGEHGRCLYRYALAQLHEPRASEGAIQDTLLAAVEAFASFQGRSSARTWLLVRYREDHRDKF